MLVTSIFFFSHNVFKRLISQGRQKSGLCGKELTEIIFNSSPNNKILDWTSLKAFADDISDVAKIMISLKDRVENIVGKGYNAGYQHFILFPQCFQKVFFLRVVESQDCVIKS